MKSEISIAIPIKFLQKVSRFFKKYALLLVVYSLALVSVGAFTLYYQNGLGLAYNDARSHLDIGRRVVEGLKPGLAQLGSVWLPLPHILIALTVWNDFMWHSGLAGAIVSMLSFVGTGWLIFKFLEKLGVGLFGCIFGVLVFAANINVLYLQSTAMTEMLLVATMTAGCYYLMLWQKDDNLLHLIKAAFWTMLATMVRYDGWFLFLFVAVLVALLFFKKGGYKVAEGASILFSTMGGFAIALWFLWNWLIFKDPFYFAFGPFSARVQQRQMEAAGVLTTKGNFLFSLKVYLYAFLYNSIAFTAIMGVFGACALWLTKKIPAGVRVATVALLAPLFFNVAALYFGHSVLFVQGLSGDTWFNVRYGVMLMPAVAIFSGFLVNRFKDVRWLIFGLFCFVTFFAFVNSDSVAIDDARVGSSQKNVSEVSGWLKRNAKNEKGFILISAASHDAIIFSSGLPMKRFIHEGTGNYWKEATTMPDKWARWMVMRTYDDNDMTYKAVKDTPGFQMYDLVDSYPFADIYQLRAEYLPDLITEPILGKQK